MLSIQKENRDGEVIQEIRRARRSVEQQKNALVKMSLENPETLTSYLERGTELSDLLEAALKGDKSLVPTGFIDLLELHREAFFFGGLLPAEILSLADKKLIINEELTELARRLRAEKGFSIFFKRFVEPAALEYFEKAGITISKEELGNLTLEEVLKYDIDKSHTRKEGSLYYLQVGPELSAVGSAYLPARVFGIEHEQGEINPTDILEGKILYMGEEETISGTAFRLEVYMLQKRNEIEMPDGAILVSNNTNPAMLKYVKMARAVLVGEGSATSHATHQSRELKKTTVNIKGVSDIISTGDRLQIVFDPDRNTAKVMIIRDMVDP